MIQLYAFAAVVGGTLLVCQFLASLAGFGDHDMIDAGHDVAVDHGAEGSWLFGLLAFRSVVAGVAFFGLSGLATSAWGAFPSLLMAIIAGAAGLVTVGAVMQAVTHLHADGTVRIERAMGCGGTVYLSVPAARGGVGKVTVDIQGRTMEYQAVTAGSEPLPTGSSVVVVGVLGPDTVEVVPAYEVARREHV